MPITKTTPRRPTAKILIPFHLSSPLFRNSPQEERYLGKIVPASFPLARHFLPLSVGGSGT